MLTPKFVLLYLCVDMVFDQLLSESYVPWC